MQNILVQKFTPGMGADKKLSIIVAESKKLDHEIKKRRRAIKKVDDEISLKEEKVHVLQEVISCFERKLEEGIKEMDKKNEKAKITFENAGKAKEENNIIQEKLHEEQKALLREISQVEEVLNKYKWYGYILFKLSPQEWQETQEIETLKVTDARKNQSAESEIVVVHTDVEKNLEPSPDGVLHSSTESILSSSSDEAAATNSNSSSDSPCEEEELKLYFSDPSEIVLGMSELRDQILFLKQNSTKEDTTLNDTFEITRVKFKEKEEKLTVQVKDVQEKIQTERKRAALLKKKVQLHSSLKSNDQDKLLDALARRVSKVHSCCVEGGLANLDTLDKLSAIEYHLFSVLQEIELIPEDEVRALRQIEESKKKNRLEMEKQQEEKEKHKERMYKCIKRCMGEVKKVTGRKLMPRCMPVKPKIQVIEEPSTPEEDDMQSDLFSD